MTDAAFWDKAARKYARSKISDIPAYEKTLERVRSHLRETDTVLEVGCGTGSTALLLSDGVTNYEGTDLSSEMIAIAKEKQVEEQLDGLTFSVSDTNLEAYKDGTYDAILAFNLWHLVPNTENAIERTWQLLKPGGLMISKTPCLGHKWYFRPLIAVMRAIGKAPFVRVLTTEQLDDMIAAAGFEIVETGLYPPKVPSRFIVARKV